MSEEGFTFPKLPRWAGYALAILGAGGGTAGGLTGLDLFGAEAKESERAAFIDHINSCETNRTEARTVAIRMVDAERDSAAAAAERCEADKAFLRGLLQP